MAFCHSLSLLFATSLLFLFVFPSHSSTRYFYAASSEPSRPGNFNDFSGYEVASEFRPLPGTSDKVNLSLYYESLCPYCRNFIVNPLARALQSDLMTILNLKLVPWGNAIMQDNKTISCQYGKDECYLNIIHACSINIWPDVKTHFNFIRCVEEQSSRIVRGNGTAQEAWQTCAVQLSLSKKDIQDCYNSGRGRELVLKYGNETDHLKPPHQFVPWVVVNDTPLLDDYINFVDYVCKAYKGRPPKACSSSHPTNSIEKKPQQTVCRRGESARDPWIH